MLSIREFIKEWGWIFEKTLILYRLIVCLFYEWL